MTKRKRAAKTKMIRQGMNPLLPQQPAKKMAAKKGMRTNPFTGKKAKRLS